MRIKILLCCIFLFCFSVGRSQTIDVGIGLGGSIYWGDLNSPSFSTNLGNTNIALQATANYVISDYISARAGLLYGTLSGDDSKSSLEWQKTRNLDFTSPLIELSLLGELHLLGNNNFAANDFFSPFLAAGVAGFRFNPSTTLNGQSYDLQPLGTEGQGIDGYPDKYSLISSALVLGGGAKIRMNEGVTIVIDVIGRRAFTDYIDDISGNYVTYRELLEGNGLTAAQLGNRMGEYLGRGEPVIVDTGSQRGGPNAPDYYITGMITFYVNLVRGYGRGRYKVDTSKCPKFK